jgi:hypothetical protein
VLRGRDCVAMHHGMNQFKTGGFVTPAVANTIE